MSHTINYIVFDLEFNQDFSSQQTIDKQLIHHPFEIIQIGAIKFDANLNPLASFNRFVKPSIYTNINSYITQLTGITTEQLLTEESFPEVYKAYTAFIGATDSIFCIWGMSDIKVLFQNANYHQLNANLLPKAYINIQPYVSLHFDLPKNQLLGLQNAVEALQIPLAHSFHNALNDAYYTAEIFKKINPFAMQPKLYDPHYILLRPKQPKREIDFNRLITQFEKMYDRTITKEEQEIISLAYQMGRTNQFLK